MGLISYIFGSDNERNIKKLKVIADKVMEREITYANMNDDELANQTNVLKQRLKNGETLNDILPDAYAVVREASWRVLKQKHYYVQVMGGIALHQGRIAEMKTGEGKTLTETLPAYLNALAEKGVHIITVNEYLASRDSEWMGKVFKFLGLSVGITLSQMDMNQKKKAYLCDITYGTNAEFGFDYLRDNMMIKRENMCQRGHFFGIVDEVDSVLIDEARTPLIISSTGGINNNDNYINANRFAKSLKKEQDLDIDEKTKQIRLTETGISKCEKFFNIENFSDIENVELNHFVLNAIKANFMMFKDKNYIVDNGEVLIVDEFTGRVMKGRRFNDGLHQAIEAKENVDIKDENLIVATITYQNYFKLYQKLSGMTGTAKTEETEFNKIYNLDVVTIPTNKPIKRIDHNDIIFSTHRAKLNAIVENIRECNEKGQPILVGTTTVEKSEELSSLLRKNKIKHTILNAKNHQKESEIIAQAGKVGAVTIATNMAGRGTDIMLGGNPEFMAKQKMREEGFEDYYIEQSTSYAQSNDEKVNEAKQEYNKLYQLYKVQTDAEKQKVIELGGLFILGTERHESRRIDNQLRGRSGRQGDIGESVFYVGLDDDLARIFGGERLQKITSFFKMDEDEPLMQMKIISKQIENAQKKIEGANFASRRTVLQFDNVLAAQREMIYDQRNKVIDGQDVHDQIVDMISELSYATINSVISDDKLYYEWDLDKLNAVIEDYLLPKGTNFVTIEKVEGMDAREVCELITNYVLENYEKKIADAKVNLGIDFGDIERMILLRTVDKAWVEHIDNMTMLRNEIFTRQDPVNTYKKEGFEMFDAMVERIRETTARFMLNSQIERVQTQNRAQSQNLKVVQNTNSGDSTTKKTIKKNAPDIGRNDPCPCGSGKKYKNCCLNKQ